MLGWTLGAIYSVPPIRTKRNPIAAGLTIATVRGFLLNFGVYYAVKDAIGAPFNWSPKVAFIARFMTMFATVIAVTKDLPDIEGDKVRCLCAIRKYVCRRLKCTKILSLTNLILTAHAGLQHRYICHQDWSPQDCQGRHILPAVKLSTSNYNRIDSSSWDFSKYSNDWRALSTCVYAHLSLSTARPRFNSFDQNVLQAHLGFVLPGIRIIHAHLTWEYIKK